MATDFRAQRLRANALIVSRSNAGDASFIIYSGSEATDFVGGISDPNMLTGVGTDVFLFVSGTTTGVPGSYKRGEKGTAVTLFGGDLIVSGTIYADRQVIEVDETVTGSLTVSGSLFVSQSLFVNQGATFNLSKEGSGGASYADFVIKSDDRDAIFKVLADTDKVGIGGPTTPLACLHIQSGTAVDVFEDLRDEANYHVLLSTYDSTNTRGIGLGFKHATTLGAIGGALIFTDTGNNGKGKLSLFNKTSDTLTDPPMETLFVDGEARAMILSGTGPAYGYTNFDDDPKNYTDLNFYVSGSIGSRITDTEDGDGQRGTAVFGGDMVVSGAFHVVSGTITYGSMPIMTFWNLDGDIGTAEVVGESNTVTIAGGTAITTTVAGTDTLTVALDNTTVTPATYNFSTVEVDQQGRLISASTGNPSFTLAGDSGTQTIDNGNTLKVAGGTGLISAAGATDTVTVDIEYAGAANAILAAAGPITPVLADTIWFSDDGDSTIKKSIIQNLPFSNNAGTVTSVATGTGLSGGPITSTGTVNLDINSLSSLNAIAAGADTLAIYDDNAATTKKVTVTNLVAAGGGGGQWNYSSYNWNPSGIAQQVIYPTDYENLRDVIWGHAQIQYADGFLGTGGTTGVGFLGGTAQFNRQNKQYGTFAVNTGDTSGGHLPIGNVAYKGKFGILVDANTRQVAILAGLPENTNTGHGIYSASQAWGVNSATHPIPDDIGFWVSGSIGGRFDNTTDTMRGIAAFGGDMHISGVLSIDHGNSINLIRTNDPMGDFNVCSPFHENKLMVQQSTDAILINTSNPGLDSGMDLYLSGTNIVFKRNTLDDDGFLIKYKKSRAAGTNPSLIAHTLEEGDHLSQTDWIGYAGPQTKWSKAAEQEVLIEKILEVNQHLGGRWRVKVAPQGRGNTWWQNSADFYNIDIRSFNFMSLFSGSHPGDVPAGFVDSPNEANYADTSVFISGSVGFKNNPHNYTTDGKGRGVTLVGGDLACSGALYLDTTFKPNGNSALPTGQVAIYAKYSGTDKLFMKIGNTETELGASSGGTVTSVGITAGDLINVVGSPVTTSGNITVDVDLDELATSTNDADGDYFAVIDASKAQRKLTKANIALSGMNNDAGWTSNAGTMSSFVITDGTTPQAIVNGNTITFASHKSMDVTVSATDTVTIASNVWDQTDAIPSVNDCVFPTNLQGMFCWGGSTLANSDFSITYYGMTTINEQGYSSADFRLESDIRQGFIMADAGSSQFHILSNGTSQANGYNDWFNRDGAGQGITPLDIGFFLSGAIGGKGVQGTLTNGVRDGNSPSAGLGTSVVGGDLVVSGAAYFEDLSFTAGAPGTIPAGTVALYGKTDSGATKLFFKHGSTETEVGAGAGGTLTTKGDLEVYTTSQTRLAVGQNGKVLTADSGATAGVAWTTPAAGKGDLGQLFASGSVSGRTYSIEGPDLFALVRQGPEERAIKAGVWKADVASSDIMEDVTAFGSAIVLKPLGGASPVKPNAFAFRMDIPPNCTKVAFVITYQAKSPPGDSPIKKMDLRLAMRYCNPGNPAGNSAGSAVSNTQFDWSTSQSIMTDANSAGWQQFHYGGIDLPATTVITTASTALATGNPPTQEIAIKDIVNKGDYSLIDTTSESNRTVDVMIARASQDAQGNPVSIMNAGQSGLDTFQGEILVYTLKAFFS